jgi:membrane protein YqaA with SNARE-associated domain
LNKLKHLLHGYSEWIKAVLLPLGPWGIFAFAAIDGSLMGMPLDAVFVGYVYHDRARFLLYVLLASLGSAVGSIFIYAIGYTGGEVLLRKKLSPERFEKIHASFDKHEFLTLMVPAMLPPPTPFKAFVLAAAAFEMRFAHFLLAIFAGRFIRFLIEALLTIYIGPQFVSLITALFAHHFKWVLIAVGAALLIGWLWHRRRQAAKRAVSQLAIETADGPALRPEQN